MISLLELAPELLEMIVGYVDDPTPITLRESTTGDLASLASTCRDLYQLANPRLYRSFNHDENWGKPYRSSKYLKTTLNRPELAAKVQELCLVPYSDRKRKGEYEEEDIEGKNSANDTFITALQAMPWWQT